MPNPEYLVLRKKYSDSAHDKQLRLLYKALDLWRSYCASWIKRALKAETELALLRGDKMLGREQENVGRAMGVQRRNGTGWLG